MLLNAVLNVPARNAVVNACHVCGQFKGVRKDTADKETTSEKAMCNGQRIRNEADFHVTFHADAGNERDEKALFGVVSKVVPTGRKNEDGEDVFGQVAWMARFVGKAREKAAALEDKTRIVLTRWSVQTCCGDGERKIHVFLLVADFDIEEESI